MSYPHFLKKWSVKLVATSQNFADLAVCENKIWKDTLKKFLYLVNFESVIVDNFNFADFTDVLYTSGVCKVKIAQPKILKKSY